MSRAGSAAVLFTCLAACRASSSPAPSHADGELVIPKLGADAGMSATPPTVAPVPSSTGSGWMVVSERGSSPSYTARAKVLEAIKKAPSRTILVHDEHVEDCSSVGGSHVYFSALEPAGAIAYYGGHGARLNGFTTGSHWLAAVEPLPVPTSHSPPCVPNHTFHQRVTALVPIANVEEGQRLLEEMSRAPR